MDAVEEIWVGAADNIVLNSIRIGTMNGSEYPVEEIPAP